MTGARDGQQDLRQGEFRRFVRWSAGAHLAVLGLVVISPFSRSSIDPSQVISVDLVSLPASAGAPPPPAPRATPVPPAEKPSPPEPPKPKEIVLPEKPEREPTKPKPKPAPQELPPKPDPEKSLEDLLADFRKDAGETQPAPEAAPAPQAAAEPAPTGVASAGTVQVSPEVLAWIRKAKIHVRGAWVVPPGFRMEALETRVVVELDASGAVVGEPRITKRSGNPWYDEGVVRGIEKSSPLPPPPRAGEWDFVFLPEDAF